MRLSKGGNALAFVQGNTLYWTRAEEEDIKGGAGRQWNEYAFPEGSTATGCCCSPDGILVCAIVLSPSPRLFVLKLPTGISGEVQEMTNAELRRASTDCRFSPDGRRVIVADRSGLVSAIELLVEGDSVKTESCEATAHPSMVLAATFNPTGEYLITTDRDEKIRVSRFPDCENVEAYCLGHREFVSNFEFSPDDGELAASAGGDGEIIVWRWRTGEKVSRVKPEPSDDERALAVTRGVPSPAISRLAWGRSRLFSSFEGGRRVAVWAVNKTETGVELQSERTLEIPGPAIGIVAFGDVLGVACTDPSVSMSFYGVEDGRRLEYCELSPKTSANGESEDEFAILYKRKFDNVAEYQERKRRRMNNETER